MVSFYQVLHDYDLLPFWGNAGEEHKKLTFDRTPMKSFSYKDTVKNSAMAKAIEQAANGMLFVDHAPSTAFEMASAMYSLPTAFAAGQFDEVWAYVEILDQLGMIEVVQVADFEDENLEYAHDYGAAQTITHYEFEIKITL
jgi:hypothetical protein